MTKGVRMVAQVFIDEPRHVTENIQGQEEMVLYFINGSKDQEPNQEVLSLHKTACLIWKMAGGADPDYEYCSDEDDGLGVVDTLALKKRFKIQDCN